MSQSSADWRGYADWMHHTPSGTMRACAHVPRYHFGDKNIDTTYPGTLDRADIVSLHDAAVSGPTAFQATAANIMGTWWTDLLATCDAAGCSGMDDPRICAQVVYRGAITLS